MSHRPRLAGDGRLLLPAEVQFDDARDAYLTNFSETLVDPFEWTDDRLLLAESFARLDLSERNAVSEWILCHGAVDWPGLRGIVLGVEGGGQEDRVQWQTADYESDMAADRQGVAWLLSTLVRLSDHRVARDWDPAWGQVIIDGAAEGMIIGGEFAGRLVVPRHLTDRDDLDPDQKQLVAATWDWPRVAVLNGAQGNIELVPRDRAEPDLVSEIEARSAVLGTTWVETVQLMRLILEPYVRIAVERLFTIELARPSARAETPFILVPHEERVWRSVLAPIHLQVFEALRRITEGEPGAATCRECGRPFLVLDARRRYFCNERERFRHAQRERRKRIRAEDVTQS